MSLATRLRARREELGLSNGQVATYLGISTAHVSDIESGKKKPSLDLLARLAKFYRTTTDYLLMGITVEEAKPASIQESQTHHEVPDREVSLVGLPNDYKRIVIDLTAALRRAESQSRERILGQFVLRMLGDFEKRFGEKATEELYLAIDLFARIGDDSELRSWFRKYLGTENFLPN